MIPIAKRCIIKCLKGIDIKDEDGEYITLEFYVPFVTAKDLFVQMYHYPIYVELQQETNWYNALYYGEYGDMPEVQLPEYEKYIKDMQDMYEMITVRNMPSNAPQFFLMPVTRDCEPFCPTSAVDFFQWALLPNALMIKIIMAAPAKAWFNMDKNSIHDALLYGILPTIHEVVLANC